MFSFGAAPPARETQGFKVLVKWEDRPEHWKVWSSFGPDERGEALESLTRASTREGAIDVKLYRVVWESESN